VTDGQALACAGVGSKRRGLKAAVQILTYASQVRGRAIGCRTWRLRIHQPARLILTCKPSSPCTLRPARLLRGRAPQHQTPHATLIVCAMQGVAQKQRHCHHPSPEEPLSPLHTRTHASPLAGHLNPPSTPSPEWPHPAPAPPHAPALRVAHPPPLPPPAASPRRLS
jgi:hypothetical protein